ncbi:Gfo/Idh/MocA family oxidoreductase [Mesorhizobium delmotii]|uniref:Gfo/Idh/MocA family oxidoreductase n=1 Tax=Mesorhizobium delmotii TaxID=1631247 RepID=UPI000F43E28A
MSVWVAIVGAGIIGTDHARIFAQSPPGSDLRVICNANESRAKRLVESLGTRRHLHRKIGGPRNSAGGRGDTRPLCP